MDYRGVIIAESLTDPDILGKLNILSTKVEPVTEKHKTPWLKQWTLHTVEIPEDAGDAIAAQLASALSKNYWYADYKNDRYHFIVYSGKVFKVDLQDPVLYEEAKRYGVALGIPDYQVDFKPEDKLWKR